MERTGFNLTITKFFDVKLPIGILQNSNEADKQFNSIGVDLYMPRPTVEFQNELIVRNPQYGCRLMEKPTTNPNFQLVDKNNNILLEYIHSEELTNKGYYVFYQNITIPTGIGFLIPEGYYMDIRPKSSCYNNNNTFVTGLIDENYTYGCGIQLLKTDTLPYGQRTPRLRIERFDVPVVINVDQKFAQIVLQKGYKILTLNEMSLQEWDINPEVIERREVRTGGFGSTGIY